MGNKKKLSVALLFGGRSTEHEVSLTSAVGIMKNIDKSKYDLIPVKISREGRWQLLSDVDALGSVELLERSKGLHVVMGDPEARGLFLIDDPSDEYSERHGNHISVDVVFPILHGTFGEDGTLQGLVNMVDLPCVGAGVLASSAGMDKIIMKQMYFQNDLPGTDFMWFLRKDWKVKRDDIIKGVTEEIGYPCFIKPANSGSSVGVYKAHDEKELSRYMEQAIAYDRKILVEKGVDARELECAVLGNDDPKASVVGEIIPAHEFYDYEAKYQSEQSRTIIPADIPEDISQQIRKLAVRAFKAIDCAGMGRVDFLLERGTNKIFVNEINTIPGFTPISMYPKLWEATGIPYTELINRLISLAIERHEDLTGSRFKRG